MGFPGEAYDNIHPYATMGHERFDFVHTLLVQLPLVPPPHQPQDFVRPRLQGDMEVGHEFLRGRNECYDPVGKQVGLNGRNTDALKAFHLVKGLYQINKPLRALAVLQAKVARVHTGEHDLLYIVADDRLRLLHDVGDGVAAAATPGQGDGAKRTGVIAPVLDLEEGPGPVLHGVGGVEPFYLFDL